MVLDHIDVALVVEAGQGILGHSANGADRVLRRDIGRLRLALGDKVGNGRVVEKLDFRHGFTPMLKAFCL